MICMWGLRLAGQRSEGRDYAWKANASLSRIILSLIDPVRPHSSRADCTIEDVTSRFFWNVGTLLYEPRDPRRSAQWPIREPHIQKTASPCCSKGMLNNIAKNGVAYGMRRKLKQFAGQLETVRFFLSTLRTTQEAWRYSSTFFFFNFVFPCIIV